MVHQEAARLLLPIEAILWDVDLYAIAENLADARTGQRHSRTQEVNRVREPS